MIRTFFFGLVLSLLYDVNIASAYCKSPSWSIDCSDLKQVNELIENDKLDLIWNHLNTPLRFSSYSSKPAKFYSRNEYIKIQKRFIELGMGILNEEPALGFYIGAVIRRAKWYMPKFTFNETTLLTDDEKRAYTTFKNQIVAFEAAVYSEKFSIRKAAAMALGDIYFHGKLALSLRSIDFKVTQDFEKARNYYKICGDLCFNQYINSQFYVSPTLALQEIDSLPEFITTEDYQDKAEIKYNFIWALSKFGLFGVKKDLEKSNQAYQTLTKWLGGAPNFSNAPKTGKEFIWLAEIFSTDKFLTSYNQGNYFPQNSELSLSFLEEAVALKESEAAQILAEKYKLGDGVRIDKLRSYAYLNLALGFEKESDNQDLFRSILKEYEREWGLTGEQVIYAEQLSNKILLELEGRNSLKTTIKPTSSYGSGFYVSTNGHIVTNAHVVNGCTNIFLQSNGRSIDVELITKDEINDIALLSAPATKEIAKFRGGRGIRQGDEVIVYGFPLTGVLANGPKLTSGNISSLAGVKNDYRYMQISAPVQPGNSGGPLLDLAGNVTGLVTAKLNSEIMKNITGSVPENVAFALKQSTLRDFLDANNINYEVSSSYTPIETSNIADIARLFTVQLSCVH